MTRLMIMLNNKIAWLSLTGLLLFNLGCSPYGADFNKAYLLAQQGQYNASEKALNEVIKPEENNVLLSQLERGVLKHLSGDLDSSNRLLQKAEQITETQHNQPPSTRLRTWLTNPRQGPYRAARYEQVYINYYKALNFSLLAQQATEHQVAEHRVKPSASSNVIASHVRSLPEEAIPYIDAARVEARRIELKLQRILAEEGSYEDAENRRTQVLFKVLQILKALLGDYQDRTALVYRENAFLHYFSGLMYEQNFEYDDARIEYQKAAELYEVGYQEQYQLDAKMVSQAWLDTARMMKKAGGYDVPLNEIIASKLTEEQSALLIQEDSNQSYLVVIEHVGKVPHREELNLHLQAIESFRTLELYPLVTGNTPEEQQDQLEWFQLMYADTGFLELLYNFSQEGIRGPLLAPFTKRFFLGNAWQTAEDLNVIDAIGSLGIRVAVPYYRPLRNVPEASFLEVNHQRFSMLTSESLAQLAVQEQLYRVHWDLRLAVAREILKNLLGTSLSSAINDEGGALLIEFVGKLAATITAQAETRNWLFLPYEIRVQKVALPAGQHTVTLNKGQAQSVQIPVHIDAGHVHLVHHRWFE